MAEIIRMDGLQEVRLALINTPVKLRRKVLYKLLRKAAQPIVRAAKANAPVAKKATNRVIPGLVKRTIGIAKSRYRNESLGEFGVFIKPITPRGIKRIGRIARKAGVKGPNFGDPFYYAFQEAGFHAVGRRKVGGGRRVRAERIKSSGARFIQGKAFMGRAFEAERHNAVKRINVELVAESIAEFNRRAKR